MKTSTDYKKQQEAIRLHNKIDTFFDNFTIGRLLNKAGIRKMRGVSPVLLLKAIFILPFEGSNFFRGIVTDKRQEFKKDAAYDLLKGPRYNWRKLLLLVAARIVCVFDLLTDKDRKKVLIIDDSTYDRSHSKFVELLARIYALAGRMGQVFCPWILFCFPLRKKRTDCRESPRILTGEPADTNDARRR